MIGLQPFFWLIFTSFDFGKIDQLFGIIGFFINLSKWKNKIFLTIVSFILILFPVISRLIQVPIETFNYFAFQIPLSLFVISYLLFIVTNILDRKSTNNS